MSQFYEGLAEILEVPVSEIGPNFSLADHGWDSLAIISCVALIDEVFGQLVAGSALAECRTVADLERLVSVSVAA
jgi:acyl carrier protein